MRMYDVIKAVVYSNSDRIASNEDGIIINKRYNVITGNDNEMELLSIIYGIGYADIMMEMFGGR